METNLSKKNKLIKQISKASDMVPFSDFLLEFMDRYGLNNLRESTVEQLEEFISNRNIIPLLGEARKGVFFNINLEERRKQSGNKVKKSQNQQG